MGQKPIELQATEQQMLQETVQLHAEARAALKNLQMAGGLYVQQAELELARSMAEWNGVRLRLELLDALEGLHPAEP